MSSLIVPGQGFVFMKIGVHAREDLSEIIARKTKEIEEAGFAMWGYGGSTCYPTTMVQPFAKEFAQKGQKIYLCMQEMKSNHFAEPLRSQEFSVDNKNWEKIPDAINVLGSKFALAIKALHQEEFELPLSRAKVAVGRSKGKFGHNYIKGQSDKGCFELNDISSMPDDGPRVKINFVAELCDPYAVFLR